MAHLKELLSKLTDVSTAADPGCTSLNKFKIDTGDARPIRKPPCRNVRDADFIDEWTDEKMKLGLVTHSISE